MASLTVENYLKAILQVQLAEGHPNVATGQLATAMGVSPGTVTSMLKTLAESGLAKYTPYAGVSLTSAGRTLAFRMVRRHRLLETFLAQTLDLTWDQVHEEAEHMEHAVSDVLIDRIDAFLGRPIADPHGDPIPSASGKLRRDKARLVPLDAAPLHCRVQIRRVLRQQSEFLRYLAEHQIGIDTAVELLAKYPEADVVIMKVGNRTVTLGRPAAKQLLVEVSPRNPGASPSRSRRQFRTSGSKSFAPEAKTDTKMPNSSKR